LKLLFVFKNARLQQVASELKMSGAKRILDLGCGENLVRELLKDEQFDAIVGMDFSYRSLELASERLDLDTMPPKQQGRIRTKMPKLSVLADKNIG